MKTYTIERAEEAQEVIYGTSDELINYAEVLLTDWVAKKLKTKARFFNYPKGDNWMEIEEKRFEPYPCEEQYELGRKVLRLTTGIDIFPIHEMVSRSQLYYWSLEKVVMQIRENRKNKSFIALRIGHEKKDRVFTSKKNRLWKKYKHLTLRDLMEDPSIKLGGSIIYFIYGSFLSENKDIIGILPKKRKDDVLGAFGAGVKAGIEMGGGPVRIFRTGEFDFMTEKQWNLRESDGMWRKAPPHVVEQLLKDREMIEMLKLLLMEKKEYCPLSFSRERGFFLKEI